MDKKDFYYHLPQELIAQTPLEPRDSSRLMKINRETGQITHDKFYNIVNYINKRDLLVFNDSKVFPARLLGEKKTTGVQVEVLLLEHKSLNTWEGIVHPGRRLPVGTMVTFGEDFTGEITEKLPNGNRYIKFHFTGGTFMEKLEKHGQMPLPHYITEKLADNSRYNTIYSKETGSAAAPTAGLHFTDNVFAQLKEKGVNTAFVTLHVGLGTFRPVKSNDITQHHMHSEFYSISTETVDKIKACKENGGKVIAVGTTSCRTLESAAKNGILTPKEEKTDIFIYPGYKFKVIDGMITNFHLPESTLIMLVSAFLGREKTLAAYDEAIKEKYRFFSFGDSTIII